MKEVLNQLPINFAEIEDLDFDCDIDTGSIDSTAADQKLPKGPDSTLQPDHKSQKL